MKTHQPIIVVTLSCLLMLTAACGKKSVRGVSGVEDLSSSEGNHEVTGHDKALYGDPLVPRGEIPLADDKGATMVAGGEEGYTNGKGFSGDPSVQVEEAPWGDGKDAGAVEALSAANLDDEKGGAVRAGGRLEGSSSVYPVSTRNGVSGSSGGAFGMGNSKGMSGARAGDQVATPASSGTSAAHEDARKDSTHVSQGLRDVFFAYDSWRLAGKSHRILESNAKWLKAHPHARITIEGHCDERGTQAYNYVLGERRAQTAKQYLSHLGVPAHQMVVVSFGKDRSVCHVFNTACFQSNRRAHFSMDMNTASRD
jgi:peptidoglycan-associated lipoprotein